MNELSPGRIAVKDLHDKISTEVARVKLLQDEYQKVDFGMGAFGLIYINRGLTKAEEAKESLDIGILESTLRELQMLE